MEIPRVPYWYHIQIPMVFLVVHLSMQNTLTKIVLYSTKSSSLWFTSQEPLLVLSSTLFLVYILTLLLFIPIMSTKVDFVLFHLLLETIIVMSTMHTNTYVYLCNIFYYSSLLACSFSHRWEKKVFKAY